MTIHLIPGLYVVATPIGNLADITHRALSVLQAVDWVAAEDTRRSRLLLEHFSINTRMLPLHAHNEHTQISKIIALIQSGQSVAMVSDAGTPIIADPGSRLVHSLHENSLPVIPIPGPSALITALSVSGLPGDQFTFAGFLPVKQQARRHHLQKMAKLTHTVIFYEAKHRIIDSIEDIQEVFGASKNMVIARELTKQFETIKSGAVSEILAWVQADQHQQLGEFVLCLPGQKECTEQACDNGEAKQILSILIAELPVKQAVKLAVQLTPLSKNQLYEMALVLKAQ